MKPRRPYHAVTEYHREPGGLRRLDFFVDRINVWKGERAPSHIRVLDIGCGKGNISFALAAQGFQVTGIDLDESSIASAEKSARDQGLSVDLVTGSEKNLHGQVFDVIIASEVFEHQTHPDKFLDQIRDLLHPGGLFLLSVPNGKSLEERLRRVTTHTALGRRVKQGIKKKIGHADIQSAASSPHVQFFSWSALQRILFVSGWRISEVCGAAAIFKESFYLGGRLLVSRDSAIFHYLDAFDDRLTPWLPLFMVDGWLIEARFTDPRQTHVVHVVPTLNAGGAEHLVIELAKRLPTHHMTTHVISIFGSGTLERMCREEGIWLSVFPRTIWSWFTIGPKLYARFRREKPDIVHTHLFGADVLGRCAAFFARVPVRISTEHNVHLDHGWLKRRCKMMLAPLTSKFIAVSDEVKRYMVAREGISSKRIVVIRNGIDVERLQLRPPRPFQDMPRLLTIGRLSPQKGQETLLRALAEVKHPWRLAIVGTGELERSLKELAESLQIASRVEWLGYRRDVPALLAQTDVFCFPSRWEGLGLAFLEAALSGVPMVVSNLPVFKEIVDETCTKFVPINDVAAWKSALESVLEDPAELIQRAYAQSQELRRTCSIQEMVKSYARIYRQTLKR